MKARIHIDTLSIVSDVDRFARSFRSESELRKRLEILLAKFPGVSGVRITHGTQEYGKDLVFYVPGPLGEPRLYACVVKNSPISGSVQSSRGARTIMLQTEQALDTPYLNSRGDEERVEHVYVISPFDCKQQTLNAIKGKFQARSGQITFVCGRELFDLFEKHWPEYLVFEADQIMAYLSALKRDLEQNPALINLTLRHPLIAEAHESLSKVYVEPGLHQTMETFSLRSYAELPLEELVQPIDRDSVNGIREYLKATSRLILILSQDRDNAADGKTLSDRLRNSADALKAAWDRSYKNNPLKSERKRMSFEPPEQCEIIIDNADELAANLAHALDEPKAIIDKFDRLIRKANRFSTKRRHDSLKILKDSNYMHYCSIQNFAEANPSAVSATRHELVLNFPENLLRQYGDSLLVTAPAGLGKTSFCKWNVLCDAKEFAKQGSGWLPIYVPMHQLASRNLGSFEDVFLKSLKDNDSVKSAQEKGAVQLRLYLDGLDEISTPKSRTELINLIREGLKSYDNLSVIITARDYVVGTSLPWLPRVRLSELRPDQVLSLISKWLDADQERIREFNKQLSSVPALGRLMSVPLLGTLIIIVYKSRAKRGASTLPENKTKLYELFVDLLCGGWDLAKDIKRESEFGPKLKMTVLSQLASDMQFEGKRECTPLEFKGAVREVVPKLLSDWKALLKDVLQDGLLVRVGKDNMFCHQSFQEFLAARHLTDPSGRRQVLALENFLSGNDWWREVVSFYVSMSSNPQDIESWLHKAREDVLDHPLPDRARTELANRTDYIKKMVRENYPQYEFRREPRPNF